MRIGLDATALPPRPVGAGQYIIHLIRAIAEQDSPHEIIVFAQQMGYDLINTPRRPGFEWVVLPNKSPARRLAWEQMVFPRILRSARIDLLHSLHYTRPFYLPCRSVVTFHDMTFFLFPELHTRAKRIFFPQAIRASARSADLLIAVSESTRQDALRLLNLPAEKIITIPLGVSPAFRPVSDPAGREAVRRKYNLPADFLLYVGLVEPRKNLPSLLRAYAALLAQSSSAPELVIVGRMGWMSDRIFSQVDELGLNGRVHFPGYVPDEDLPMVYNLARLFVYPSTYEGFGLPPLEAMACGTPVITTRVSSMPEHVGDAGVLIPPQDEYALTQALIDLLRNPEMQQELAVKGLQRAAFYSWTRTARETLKAYERLCSAQ